MIIEIDDDCVDTIIQHALVKDYVHLTADLKAGGLHPDDKDAYEQVTEAIKVLSHWYFINGEFDKAVKKARKK